MKHNQLHRISVQHSLDCFLWISVTKTTFAASRFFRMIAHILDLRMHLVTGDFLGQLLDFGLTKVIFIPTITPIFTRAAANIKIKDFVILSIFAIGKTLMKYARMSNTQHVAFRPLWPPLEK
eukprot:UN04616